MRFASVAMRGDIPRNCGHLRFFLSKSRRICAGLLPSPVAVVKEYGEKTITDTDCAQRVLHSCHRAGRNDSLIAKNQESEYRLEMANQKSRSIMAAERTIMGLRHIQVDA